MNLINELILDFDLILRCSTVMYFNLTPTFGGFYQEVGARCVPEGLYGVRVLSHKHKCKNIKTCKHKNVFICNHQIKKI